MSGAAHPVGLGRICTPAETISRVRPHMAALGITRLARQTGLDRIGIPVWAAVRPNALALAVNQGKGIDDDAACASALMEAAEYAVAERPDVPARLATAGELRAAGERVFLPARQMAKAYVLDEDLALRWLPARQFHGRERCWIPYEAVRLDHTQDVFGAMSRSSNGLASGNDETEAVLHAVCELVERDARTLAGFRARETLSASRIDPAAFGCGAVDRLCERIRKAGFSVALFDLTTQIGIPVVQAVVRDARIEPHKQLDLAGGSGCHPLAFQAALRAITEAVQTRITNISGARDDIDPAEYREPLRRGLEAYVSPLRGEGRQRPPASLACGSREPAALLEAVAARLLAAGIRDVVLVPLGGSRFGISVVKVFAAQLEDRPVNRHWRPGPRLAEAMLRLW